MQVNNLLGLIKFFGNEDFLDKLVGGLMHCQTPERYRQSKQEGVSDKHESCSYAWRSERDDSAISVIINGKELPSDGLKALTIHNGQPSESWLSCWFMLQLPPDENELARLINDIKRMKDEFGRNFAFIPRDQIEPFLKKVKSIAPMPIWAEQVEYSEDYMQWSWRCKSTAYAYQREYRIGFGNCAVTELESREFICADGFGEFIFKNSNLQFKNEKTGRVFFDLLEI